MREVGLTRGAFHGQFPCKEGLAASAVGASTDIGPLAIRDGSHERVPSHRREDSIPRGVKGICPVGKNSR